MRNTTRALAATAAGALAALTLSVAPALAQPDVPSAPDPTTCTDGLLTLVKVRTTEDHQHTSVTVAEQQDAAAQAALHKAQQDDANAKAVEAATLAKWNKARSDLATINAEALPHNATWQKRHDDAVAAEQSAYQAYLDAQKDRAAADAALVKAHQDAQAKRSYLAELRVDLNHTHADVVRLTVLVDRLCNNHTPPPPPVDTTTDTPAPPVSTDVPPTTEAPVPSNNGTVIVNNPQIGQVPTGSNTGGGSEADSVE